MAPLQENSCQGEHGINKEACNAKSGRADRMFGFSDGRRPDLTERASTARQSSVRSTLLPTETSPSKQLKRCASTPTNKPRRRKAGRETIAELVAHYRLKELAGESKGRKAFSTRAAYECYLDELDSASLGRSRLDQVKPVAVEEWLDGIKRAKRDESQDSEHHERNLPSRDAVRVG